MFSTKLMHNLFEINIFNNLIVKFEVKKNAIQMSVIDKKKTCFSILILKLLFHINPVSGHIIK